MPGLNEDIEFIHFFAPGIVAMSILFSSMFAGISVLWDKQFGFLQEVLVAPVSRISIIVGRTLGGATTAIIQGFIILIIAIAIGTPISGVIGFILTIIFMILIAFSAVGFGLILASKMQDFQSFPIIINLIIMPLLFLSSAFFPVAENKTLLTIAYFNPIFYMVDGLRGSMIGIDNSVIQNPLISIVIVLIICIIMLFLGSYLFSKSEA
jgi:ABC-2 type transport system permease protein